MQGCATPTVSTIDVSARLQEQSHALLAVVAVALNSLVQRRFLRLYGLTINVRAVREQLANDVNPPTKNSEMEWRKPTSFSSLINVASRREEPRDQGGLPVLRGTGEGGKTTLIKLVDVHTEVRQHFSHHLIDGDQGLPRARDHCCCLHLGLQMEL